MSLHQCLARAATARISLALILVVQAGLLIWSSAVHSPTWDEPAHLVSGLAHWKFGRFDLYSVNPPLVRMIAAGPLLIIDEPKMEWQDKLAKPGAREEVYLARRMIELNGRDSYRHIFLARLAVVPIALIGTCLCYVVAKELFGVAAGLFAAFLWAFSPSVLAYGSVITPDLASAVVVMGVAYTFHHWLAASTWRNALGLMFALSVAILVKSVWILLPPTLVVAWLLYESVRFVRSRSLSNQRGLPGLFSAKVKQLVVVCIGSLFLVNWFYGFEGSLKPLGSYRFVSQLFVGSDEASTAPSVRSNNRFASSWLASVPVPLPKNYLSGIDSQRKDFESGMTSPGWQSYLNGEWQQGGWWYFYVVGLFYKESLALWILVAIASVFCAISGVRRAPLTLLYALFVPTLMLMVLISIQTGLNRYVRYALPVVPLLCIWASQLMRGGEWLRQRNRSVDGFENKPWLILPRTIVAAACCILLVAEVTDSSPNWLSYFNRFAGGTANGYKFLCDSNVDWGQDLPALESWLDAHPEAKKSLHLAYFGSFDPLNFGTRFRLPPRLDMQSHDSTAWNGRISKLVDGWYVVSKNYVVGHTMPVPDGTSKLVFESLIDGDFSYFSHLRPVDQIGDSMLVYRITRSDREELSTAVFHKARAKAKSHESPLSVATLNQP